MPRCDVAVTITGEDDSLAILNIAVDLPPAPTKAMQEKDCDRSAFASDKVMFGLYILNCERMYK